MDSSNCTTLKLDSKDHTGSGTNNRAVTRTSRVEGDVGDVQEVVGEVLLDDVALVSQADNEFVDALLRVQLEDVPQNGLAANLHHGLGADRVFFAKTRTETAGKNDRFHLRNFLINRDLEQRAVGHPRSAAPV